MFCDYYDNEELGNKNLRVIKDEYIRLKNLLIDNEVKILHY